MHAKVSSKLLDDTCNILLANKKIRYIGILDKMGSLVFEKQKDGVDLSLPDSKSRSLYIKSVLEILLKKDFDEQMGLLKYNVSHRSKIDVITIPIFNNIVMITLEPNENCDLIANSAIMIFEKIFMK
ncbi:hypothetical protein NKOR_05905 [Candidatus Nitrosopumilus koreensis AR1]|uniref:Roadblock/LAMTOR2 domain-containing protein n=1 Tax=Candidatus Nitrosopumilus koreensis AR1 TaxID=1229908 RepID=K0B6G0_9ARCH|nr:MULTISPECIES: DUF6659 family protein [Nitrosopumilus]AFS81064.1 hypothetical protein NKOR_05905 [Candidatus Nitrosopumilus koreensis AR1]